MYGYGYQYSNVLIGGSIAPVLFAAFRERVIADSGIVENSTCAVRFLNEIIQ